MSTFAKRDSIIRPLIGLVVVLSTVGTVSGAPISGVTVSGFSSQLVGGYFPLTNGIFHRPASATVDGLYASGDDAFDNSPAGPLPGGRLWLTEGVGVPRANGTLTNDTAPFIKFNLGGPYDLNQLVVFNENEATPAPEGYIPPPGHTYNQRGVKTADLTTILNGVATDLGVFTFNQAPGVAGFSPQSFNLPSGTLADSVLITILSNYNGDTFGPGGKIVSPDFGFVGLNEVQFVGSSVPLPAGAWGGVVSLLLVGGLAKVRRRIAVA